MDNNEVLPALDMRRLPRHIAIIMDGNGRWAEQRGLPRLAGHEAGVRSVRAVIEVCRELPGVEVLTLYAFSTENWRRSEDEVNALFQLMGKAIRAELDELRANNIRALFMGRRDRLPAGSLEDIALCEERTRANTALTVNVALDYGSRTEIAHAARRIAERAAAGELKPEDIDEACVAAHMYQPGLPDPELLIRTSGELRLSNFMLWQLSYAEIVVTPILWPDFRRPGLYAAIADYQTRSRRFGGRPQGDPAAP